MLRKYLKFAIDHNLDEMEDLSGVYHEEFADTDGDGEEELIVFLIVPDHNEDGEEFYSLLIYGCDISENGIPVSGWYWSDWCNTAALNDRREYKQKPDEISSQSSIWSDLFR